MIRLLSFIISLFTWGSVNLVTVDYTKDIYMPIAELNNHSLSEVFVDNNAILQSNLTLDLGVTRDNNNFLLNYNGTTRDVGFQFDLLFSSGSHIYVSYQRNGYTTNSYNFQYFDYESIANPFIINSLTSNAGTYEQKYSTITQIDRNGARFFPRSYTGDINVELNYYIIIDLTSLGIDNLTVEEINVYYQQYLDNKDNPPYERFEVTVNDLTITDLVILMSFSFGYVIVFLVIRKVVKKK